MPLPVVHSFAGYSVYRLVRKQENSWGLLIGCVLLANFADFDILPGLLLGEANRFHRGCAHSLLFAFLFSLVITIARGFLTKRIHSATAFSTHSRTFLIAFAAYATHVFLDMLSGPGVPLFWPFQKENVAFPVALFSINHSQVNYMEVMDGFSGFFRVFFSPLVMRPLFFEAAICFAIWTVFCAVKDLREGIAFRKSWAWTRAIQAVMFMAAFIRLRRTPWSLTWNKCESSATGMSPSSVRRTDPASTGEAGLPYFLELCEAPS